MVLIVMLLNNDQDATFGRLMIFQIVQTYIKLQSWKELGKTSSCADWRRNKHCSLASFN